MELAKAYNSKDVESDIYKRWEESGYFNPDKLPGKRPESFSISMPPPNVTGALHLGHAMENSIMDIETRFERMRGKKTLLIPGTDHAAVATQARVEQDLIESGKYKNPQEELGREKLLDVIRNYAEQSKATILDQIRKLGTSCDWTRLAYTFDAERSKAVNEMFVRMFNDGLIYRGHRIVNWDPKLQTTVSDDELEWAEEKAPFYYFKYGPFEIGTARPETKFGDKYVVMHPADKRYKQYKHGDTFEAEWINGQITGTIIKDEAVDPEFGTGVMTITPWHDMVDFEIAERHKLDKEQVIDWHGHLLPIAEEFQGQYILKARPKIVEKLKGKGLLTRIDKDYVHRVARSDRGKALVEPQIKEQWFVAVNKDIPGKSKSLKDLMREAVTSGHNGHKDQVITIQPEHYHKIYLHWIDNLRDWCISRQIWWGHRIPVWYRSAQKNKKTEEQKDSLEITYFVHGTTTDNQEGNRTGWNQGVLSDLGKQQNLDLRKLLKERGDDYDVVISSDLARAKETAKTAFADCASKITFDERLRECNYGDLNGQSGEKFDSDPYYYIQNKHPNGENYKDVEKRIKSLLADLHTKYRGKKIAFVAHKYPQLALKVLTENKTWHQAIDEDWRNKGKWQPGWKYNYGVTSRQEIHVGQEPPKGKGWEQDPDTLDTWFSSATWTFSLLGWPGQTKDLKEFHPNSWMQMGKDILFFWMARMILMSTYALDEIPFRDVYIHGMLRDEKGQKFSKSLRNAFDPMEVVDQYGADALRLTMVTGISPGADSRFYTEKIKHQKNFINKLWNIARFTMLQLDADQAQAVKATTLADKWVLSRLNNLTLQVTQDLEKYRFSQASERLQEFTWHEFADWYLEIAKHEGDKQAILRQVLETLLKLWHPFVPFVTEHIWSLLQQPKTQNLEPSNLLMIQEWPKADEDYFDENVEAKFSQFQIMLTEVRNYKAKKNIPMKTEEEMSRDSAKGLGDELIELIEKMGNVKFK